MHPNICGFRTENDIQLVEGEYYWLEVYVANYPWTGNVQVSVEAPAVPN